MIALAATAAPMLPAYLILVCALAFFGLFVYVMCCKVSDFRARRLAAAIDYEMWDENDVLSVEKALPGETGVDIDKAL